MNKMYILKNIRMVLYHAFLSLMACTVLAQEGHPLDGTWSGDRLVAGEKVRVLLVMKLLPDQSFDAMLIENGARIPLSDVTLYHEDWTVSLEVDGKNRAGETVRYSVSGEIQNLGSTFDRMIVGKWSNGRDEGEFKVTMN